MNVWRERLARWFDPLARRCPLSPNSITTIALLLNIGAATLLYLGSARPHLFLAAVATLIVGGLLDAFDGIVARVQSKSSPFGDFYDHLADRISDTLLLTGWTLGNGVRPEIVIASIVAVMLNGYVGTQMEATFGSREYDTVGRGEFVLALVALPILSFILATNNLQPGLGALTLAEWLTLLLTLFAIVGVLQRVKLARRLGEPS